MALDAHLNTSVGYLHGMLISFLVHVVSSSSPALVLPQRGGFFMRATHDRLVTALRENEESA